MNNTGKKKFYPYYLFEITVMAVLVVQAVLVLALLFPPAIGRAVDVSAKYNPLPEWYFLFLYELTMYFPGPWTFVGAALLPGLAFALLLLAPFLDRGKDASLRSRPIAAVTGFTMLTAVVVLTILALL